MNDNIRAIWNRAASSHQQAETSRETQENFLNRFAELIVRECAEIVEETRWMVPPSQEQIARSIKQHFGVES